MPQLLLSILEAVPQFSHGHKFNRHTIRIHTADLKTRIVTDTRELLKKEIAHAARHDASE
jgi:hypothetical protein